MRNIKIIEFNGIPASGKTTLITELIATIELTYKVATLDDVYFYNEGTLFRKYQNFLISLFSFRNLHFNYYSLKHMLGFSFNRDRVKYTLRLIKLNSQLDKFQRLADPSFDYILLEEGLIQHLISISHIDPINDNSKLNVLCSNLFSNNKIDLIVSCDIDIKTAARRSKNRNRLNHRFDRLDLIELETSLQRNQYSFDKVRANLINQNTLTLNMLDDSDKLIGKILNRMEN